MPQSLKDRVEMNRYLARHEFGELHDAGLLPQLAMAVDDEATLKRVLNLAAPEDRRDAYEALRPYLRFEPRPLDVLLSEIALDAEIRQLPVIQADGTFRAFNVSEIQEAVDKATATGVLELVCDRCTKAAQIAAISREFAMELARNLGWTQKAGVLRCPVCSENLGIEPAEQRIHTAINEPRIVKMTEEMAKEAAEIMRRAEALKKSLEKHEEHE